MNEPLEAVLARVETFVAALEYRGHGRSIVSCQYGHEAHWPGETREYVPLHAGDLRDLVDAVKRLSERNRLLNDAIDDQQDELARMHNMLKHVREGAARPRASKLSRSP